MEPCQVCGDWVETDGESSDDVYCSQYCREYTKDIDTQETQS